jgi:hypothetical protein
VEILTYPIPLPVLDLEQFFFKPLPHGDVPRDDRAHPNRRHLKWST